MINEKLLQQIEDYVDKNHFKDNNTYLNKSQNSSHSSKDGQLLIRSIGHFAGLVNLNNNVFKEHRTKEICHIEDLMEFLEEADEGFIDKLYKLIDKHGLNEVDVYKKAYIDRRLFSKMRSKENYRPKKATVIQLALAMELSLDETIDLLATAEHAFSKSSKRDIIIEFCIKNQIYDILQVDEILYKFQQRTLLPQK